MNHRSERQSPGGSTAFSRHCSSRWVFVNEPSFSVCAAAGRKKTSVPMSSVRARRTRSPGVVPERRRLDLDRCRARRASRGSPAPCAAARELALPTAGFCADEKKPLHVPSIIALEHRGSTEWSPSMRGRWPKQKSLLGGRVLAPPRLQQRRRVRLQLAPRAVRGPFLATNSSSVAAPPGAASGCSSGGCRRASGCRSSPGCSRGRAGRGSRRRGARCCRAAAG